MDTRQATQAEVPALNLRNDYPLREAAEWDIRNLYSTVCDNLEESSDVMSEEISKIIDNFKYNQGGSYWKNDWNCPKVRLAYTFRYASHGAGLTRFKTLDALENCPQLRSILSKPHLKVVSLGCGSGNDMIGFLCALEQAGFSGDLTTDLVDMVSGWSEVVSQVNQIPRQDGYGVVSKVFKKRPELNFRFIQRTLLDDKFSLEEYDVIIVCKLLTIDWNNKEKYIRSFLSSMNESAFILLIDALKDDFYKGYESQILYLSGPDPNNRADYYISKATEERYDRNDEVSSKARIAIMQKKLI